jgi:prepilin-type N-terminal cleavage/methylation domain-containing protein
MFKKQKGFTLIELLVVIAIIGILATIVLVSLNSARVKARDARRQSDIQQISLAMEMYYDANTSTYFQSATMPTAIGTYMTIVPKDPGSGSPSYGWYDNTGATNTQKYCVYATLEAPAVTTYVVANPGGTKQSPGHGTDLASCAAL